ncbi:MAG: HisA/HisF-related TIM barrel protein [Burkholderiales bacterium]
MPALAKLHLIPVIDVLRGQVVHAREGRRAEYAPIQSSLCEGSDPHTILTALLQLHPFRTVYFADLDAIQRQGSNQEIFARLRKGFPAVEFWLDSGIADEAALERSVREGIAQTVIGSESLKRADFMLVARDICRDDRLVLSLDFKEETFMGPQPLLDHPQRYWPQYVLAMNLQRIGSCKGPDLALIVKLAQRVPGCRVYAAGGVRSAEDLHDVAAAGAGGALIASALHDGRVGATQLQQFL